MFKQSRGRRIRPHTPAAVVPALITLLALALAAVPAGATAADPSGPEVTVQIEGQDATLVERAPVALDFNRFSPPPPWPGSGCPANSIAAAIEAALDQSRGMPPADGWWNRSAYIGTILGETHAFAANDYWAAYVNHDLTNRGACDGGASLGLDQGDRVQVQAVVSGPPPTYVPAEVTVEESGSAIEGPANVPVGRPFQIRVTPFVPPDTDNPPLPSPPRRAVPTAGLDYTVAALPRGYLYDSAGAASAAIASDRTDASGIATLSIDRPGPAEVKAVREASAAAFGASGLGPGGRSAAEPICAYVPNGGGCGTPRFRPQSLDLGRVETGSIGGPDRIVVTAGDEPAKVLGARVTGPDASDFLLSEGNCVDRRMQPGSDCELTVRLAPSRAGDRHAVLRVRDGAESLPREIPLAGRGSAPARPPLPVSEAPSLRIGPVEAGGPGRGGRIVVRATLRNLGPGAATDAFICVRAPARVRVSRSCAKAARVSPGTRVTRKFRLRLPKARGHRAGARGHGRGGRRGTARRHGRRGRAGHLRRAHRKGARRTGAQRRRALRHRARRHGARRDGARRDGARRDGDRRHGARRDGDRRHGARRHGVHRYLLRLRATADGVGYARARIRVRGR